MVWSAVLMTDSHRSAGALDPETAERLRVDVESYLAWRSGDPDLAEDLAQQTLLNVIRGLPEFRGDAELRTWARRVASNVWHDHLRRRGRAVAKDAVSVLELLDALDPSEPSDVEQSHDRRTSRECLNEAARQLSEDARRIVVLRDFAGLSLEQIAAEFGCSVGAAKVRLHRARRKLGEICRDVCVREVGRDGEVICTPKPGGAERSPAAPPTSRRN
jgi:RNA polymerase sigma-70 factor (ECF subfamily)